MTTQRFRHAVVVGKFLPPHAGHLHLIAEAARRAQTLTVLACSVPTEPIPGSLRVRWLQEACADLADGSRIRIVPVPALLPQAPPEHPTFWQQWTALVHTMAPGADLLCTSEAYGPPFAAALGLPHVAIDPARMTIPCSGTAVRANPFAEWAHLSPGVRAYFAYRVAILGPESTGKSTLAAACAAALETAWVPEYGRTYTDTHPTTSLTPAALAHIGFTQVSHEAAAARTANRILFCDTDPLTTATWSELLCGTVEPALEILAERHQYPLTILCGDDVPWTQDGTRAHATARAWHAAYLRERLAALGRPVVEVRGSVAERVAQVIAAVRTHEPRALC